MNIAVIDVAAESGGALSVLNDFCDELRKIETKDHWYIVTSVVKIDETEYLHNIRIPGIKRSWFHRIFWEKFCFSKLMREQKIDVVVSLQNNALPKGNWKQVVYFHNVLLLKHNISFSFFKGEERPFFIYSKILGPYIRRTWKNADKMYVQTENVKRLVGESGFRGDVEVVLPDANIKGKIEYARKKIRGYIYPVAAISYKNHMAIIRAVEKINKDKIRTEILFTIDGSENKYANQIVERSKKVPGIQCVGKMSRDKLFQCYSNYGVVMASKIESFGMPLLEAKMFQTVIVALDYPYARELLSDYNRAYLTTEDKLGEAILNGMKDMQQGNYVSNKRTGWEKMICSVKEMGKIR